MECCLILNKNVYLNMNYSYLPTMYEFQVEKYYLHFYAPNFEEVEEAYWFLACPSVPLSVSPPSVCPLHLRTVKNH